MTKLEQLKNIAGTMCRQAIMPEQDIILSILYYKEVKKQIDEVIEALETLNGDNNIDGTVLLRYDTQADIELSPWDIQIRPVMRGDNMTNNFKIWFNPNNITKMPYLLREKSGIGGGLRLDKHETKVINDRIHHSDMIDLIIDAMHRERERTEGFIKYLRKEVDSTTDYPPEKNKVITKEKEAVHG